MLLRYKLRDTPEDKYHFMTYWQYEPPMVIESGPSSSLRIPPGTKASPPPSADVVAKTNSSLFFSVRGLNEDITEDTFKREFLKYLKEEHRNLVIDFKKQKKGLAIAYFDSWASAKLVADTYKEKFMDCNVMFSLFCPQNPSAIV